MLQGIVKNAFYNKKVVLAELSFDNN